MLGGAAMKLTIIMPVYNLEDCIEKTLLSILNQSRKDFQLIVVDDGSTDSTYYKAHRILLKSGWKNYQIIRQANRGVSGARNTGLQEAAGEYVMFLDGDDRIDGELVALINESLMVDVPDVVCWGADRIREDGSLAEGYFERYKHRSDSLSGAEAIRMIFLDRTWWICTGSGAFRKGFLDENKIRYTEGCRNGEDQEFTLNVLSRASRVLFIDQVLTYYICRDGSVTNSCSISKFDAVEAVSRACSDLYQRKDKEMKILGETVMAPLLVENYLNSLDSCIVSLRIRPLLKELDQKYPGIREKIRRAMIAYPGHKYPYDMKCRIYLLSPELYGGLFWLKHGRNR